MCAGDSGLVFECGANITLNSQLQIGPVKGYVNGNVTISSADSTAKRAKLQYRYGTTISSLDVCFLLSTFIMFACMYA